MSKRVGQRLFGRASRFAISAHETQRYGRRPYEYHLIQVVLNYPRFRDWSEVHQHIIDACWLHDYVEDCSQPSEELVAQVGVEFATADQRDQNLKCLTQMFGEKAAQVVRAVTNVTDPSTGKGVPNYKLIRETEGALTVKLCDRIANVENSVSHDRLGRGPHKFFWRYRDQYPKFQEELRGRCRGESASELLMWQHLDKLFDNTTITK